MAQQTSILILDEPVSNLDILHQLEILQLLKRLNKDKNITIIAVLHDLNHIINYAQEVILLHQGNVIAHGHPLDVLNNENIKHVFSVNTLFIDNPTNGNKILVYARFLKYKTLNMNKKVIVSWSGGKDCKLCII